MLGLASKCYHYHNVIGSFTLTYDELVYLNMVTLYKDEIYNLLTMEVNV